MLALVIIYTPINRYKRNKYLVKRVYSLLVSDARENTMDSDSSKTLNKYISKTLDDSKSNK